MVSAKDSVKVMVDRILALTVHHRGDFYGFVIKIAQAHCCSAA